MTDDLDQFTAAKPADIRRGAMDLLARREYCRRELKQKLMSRFGDEELIDEQLDRLSEEKLQSDTRYAESLLRQRINRGHGPLRIRQEMRHKGMADSVISAALETESPDWYALAEETYRRRFGALPTADIKEKAKRSRFMHYRGFDAEYFRHLLE